MIRLLRKVGPFPPLHAFNALLSMAFSLGQTLVFARALDRIQFAAVIAAISVGFYLLPINQAVARANFHLIRRAVVAGHGEDGHSEAAAAFHLSQGVMIAAGLLAPLLIAHGDLMFYLALAAFTVSANLGNLWYFEIQTTLIAVDRPVAFEVATLIRRLASFVALGWLLISHDLLIFSVAILLLTLLAQAWVLRDVAKRSDLFDIPRQLAWPDALQHLRLFWASLLATLAEWLSLSGPYAAFTMRYGVGPALIVLDTGMKLLRIVTAVVRNLSEIALPRVSRAVISGSAQDVRRLVLMVLALSSLPALVVAGALCVDDRQIWRVLLAKTAVMPPGVGLPVATAILASVGFQAGSHLVGHVGRPSELRRFTAVAALGAVVSSLYVMALSPSLLASMWAVTGGLVIGALAGGWAAARILTR